VDDDAGPTGSVLRLRPELSSWGAYFDSSTQATDAARQLRRRSTGLTSETSCQNVRLDHKQRPGRFRLRPAVGTWRGPREAPPIRRLLASIGWSCSVIVLGAPLARQLPLEWRPLQFAGVV
jgi:hypothetical protein